MQVSLAFTHLLTTRILEFPSETSIDICPFTCSTATRTPAGNNQFNWTVKLHQKNAIGHTFYCSGGSTWKHFIGV